MALVSYTMIGASLAPPLLAAFFWKRVTRIAGVLSIASGMLSVITITALNSIFKGSETEILGIAFPMDTDYIAIPAVIVSVTTLVVVSLLTPKPLESDWQEFIDNHSAATE
jgi:Na+/proline symporter